MGCICSKGQPSEDVSTACHHGRGSIKQFAAAFSFRRDDDQQIPPAAAAPYGLSRMASKREQNAVVPLPSDEESRKTTIITAPQPKRMNTLTHHRRATVDSSASSITTDGADPPPLVGLPANGFEAEHVAAGWPLWLVSVAAEAVKGWVPRRPDSFEKLQKIGQGTYSVVYKARDLDSGKIVALKKVRFVNMDPESVKFMAREIHILRKLDHPNVIKLEGLITSKMSGSLYLVFEYMEHDLAGIATTPGIKFTEPQVKCYMKQLLCGLEHCHSRGILHRDIKGSNLLIDDNGNLKLGDFGLATSFSPDQKQPLTSRVVTLWYRPPELLLGATEYGVAVDLWSAGCILAELLAGKPIMPGRTEVEQMHKIFKLCGSPPDEYWNKTKLPHATIFRPQHPYPRRVREVYKDFPATALDLLDILLAMKPQNRQTATSALNSEFLTTEPLACKPSELPKRPPSKEYDAKLRDGEARRRKQQLARGCGSESVKDGLTDQKRASGQAAVARFESSLQQKQKQPNVNVIGRNYNPQEGDVTMYQSKEGKQRGISHSSSMLHLNAAGSSWASKVKGSVDWTSSSSGIKSGNNNPESKNGQFSPQSLAASNLDRGRTKGMHENSSKQPHWPEHRPKFNQLDVIDSSERQDWSHHGADRPASSHSKDDRTSVHAPSSAYGGKKNRLHYSGPLMPPGGNLEDMLKEHERQIQEAVRKARLDKSKSRKT